MFRLSSQSYFFFHDSSPSFNKSNTRGVTSKAGTATFPEHWVHPCFSGVPFLCSGLSFCHFPFRNCVVYLSIYVFLYLPTFLIRFRLSFLKKTKNFPTAFFFLKIYSIQTLRYNTLKIDPTGKTIAIKIRSPSLSFFPLFPWYFSILSRVPHVKQELLTLLEHLNSPTVFSGLCVGRSLVFYVMFCRSLFVLLFHFCW